MFTEFENLAVACICLLIFLYRDPGKEPEAQQMAGLGEALESLEPKLTLLLIRKLSSQRAKNPSKCP